MRPQILPSRFFLQQTALLILCCSVPTGATASVLQLVIPAILNNEPKPDPYWRTPQVLAENLDSVSSMQLAGDTTGNALVAWTQTGGIYSRCYQNRVGWGEAEYAGTGGAELQIAMNAAGKAVAVWTKYDGETDKAYLYAQLYTAGVGWNEATVIGSSEIPVMSPVVVIDFSGRIVAIWSKGTRPSDFWSSSYDGTSWTIVEIPDGYGMGMADPNLGMDGAGNAIFAWLHRGSNFYNAAAARYERGVGWGTREYIAEVTYYTNSSSLHLSVNSSGNAVAVWQQTVENEGIWMNWYEVGTGWGTAQPWTSGTEVNDIALDAAGNAIAVWQQSDGTRTNILASRYTVGTGWGTAELIETNDSGDAQEPKIVVDGNGNAIVVWQQSDGTHTNIWANRYTVGSGWATAERIDTASSDDASEPQLVISTKGKATVMWLQFDGTKYSIWANRFE